MQDHKAGSWATAEGTILSSKCEDYSDWDNGASYFAHAEYRYAVEGKVYQGNRIALGYSGGWWRRPNQKIADRLSPGSTVLVRYDPGKPSMSVLACGLNGSIVRTLFAGTWLLLLTAAAFSYSVRSRGAGGRLALSWGTYGFKIVTQGVGGIVLLALAGWVIVALLSATLDAGIVGALVTR